MRKGKRIKAILINPESQENHRKFAKLRAQHYNMKSVLQHSKELLENEELDEHFNDPDYHDVEELSSDKEADEDEEDEDE
jgi:hypothetical protein